MWVWVNSRSWWWTGRPGVLQFMGSQRVGHDWATELNWRTALIWTFEDGWVAWPWDSGSRTCFPCTKFQRLSIILYLMPGPRLPKVPGFILLTLISILSAPKETFLSKAYSVPCQRYLSKKKKLIFSTICTIGSEGGNHWCICECCEETFIQKEKYGSSVKINAIERKNGLTEILYIFHKEGERNDNWISVKYKYDEKWNHFVHEV